MLLLISAVKAFSEVLVLGLLGRGLLRLVLRQRSEGNVVYRLFAAVTRPLMRLSRWITPRFVADRHLWIVAALLVLVIWVAAAQQKLALCKAEAAGDPLCVEMRQPAAGR